MCTAVTLKTDNFYFGRTLDYGRSFGEEVVITPRGYLIKCGAQSFKTSYAMVGTAFVPESTPLYYDAVNEKGLCMAGLNFVGNAVYGKPCKKTVEVPQYAIIPFILGKCACVEEALRLIKQTIITDEAYSENLPVAELHWIIADKRRCITVECVKQGLKIYDNELGVLTNNPPFDMQLFNLNNYMSVSPREPVNLFSGKLNLQTYSRGMGALGLPGDLSSQSRFVRAAFYKLNSVSGTGEEESVSRFFHILGTVNCTRGGCILNDGEYETTIYSSCCNADKTIYYYTTYGNRSVTAVDMRRADLNSQTLYRYPFENALRIEFKN